ncbi:unnamed protein product [Acidithrix sp. C25]|nr:unnamed protein product [Acidithrix sp. C25]
MVSQSNPIGISRALSLPRLFHVSSTSLPRLFHVSSTSLPPFCWAGRSDVDLLDRNVIVWALYLLFCHIGLILNQDIIVNVSF